MAEAPVAHPPADGAALAIVERTELGLVLTDAAQRILYVNPAFSAITGYSAAEAIGQTPRLLSSGRQSAAFYREMMQALVNAGAWRGEVWNRKKDGTLYLEWLDIHAWRDATGAITNFLAAFSPIERYQLPQERLRFLALHDPITGLANRILLNDQGERAMQRAQRAERSLAALFIDLDRFKSINDDYGHAVGDQVLREVAQRLTGALRSGDTLAHVGADEFVCLLPDISQREDANRVAGNLLAAIAPPVCVGEQRFRISASIGIGTWHSCDAGQFDELIIRAEQAMLRAKQAGGNLFRFFCPEMAASAGRQMELEARLDAAIDAGELELHFQPKVDLHSGCVVGAEALVRWRDPRLGLIPPGDFIPVAEKSDLIVRIDAWVLRSACAALARWERAGRLPDGFRVAINISAKQFERGDLPGDVDAVLADCGVQPSRLQLEVTESLIIKNPAAVAATLRRIADCGVSVALDDFGTAYSNLMSLARLPIDAFKLDQSFVRDVDSNRTHATIARAVWHLGDGLGKEIVAEGIETCAECRHLMELGYRIGQGYKYGRPMTETRFLDYLDEWGGGSCHACPRTRLFSQPLTA